MTATAFYGGSFDPPHKGHLGIALGALKSGRTRRVLFAPAYDPPHKHGKKRAPFADRLAMVKLLIAGHPGLEACDIESRLALHPSYTIEVLAALERERPGERLQLLIGSDSLRQLHSWARAGELAERYEILTWPRPGERIDPEELARFWPPRIVKKLLSGVLSGNFFEISSTGIRNDVAKQREMYHINRGITPEVWEYIRSKQLYTGDGMTSVTKPNPAELADFCVKCVDEKLAENTVKIHVGDSSSVADYFVIATANSEPQLRALTGFLEREVREKFALRPLSESGESASGWVLIDLGTVIVHIMTPEVRDRYNLEGLWGEKPSEEAVKSLTEHHP